MSDTLAQQFSGVYRELVEQRAYSDVARVPLDEAPARGQALRLVIYQCDSDDLFLAGTIRRWWVIDDVGWHPDGEWPVTQAQLDAKDGQSHHPHVRFATDGRRVRFGMCLGRGWYVSREAPLGPDGRFIAGELAEIYTHIGSLYRSGAQPRRGLLSRLCDLIK